MGYKASNPDLNERQLQDEIAKLVIQGDVARFREFIKDIEPPFLKTVFENPSLISEGSNMFSLLGCAVRNQNEDMVKQILDTSKTVNADLSVPVLFQGKGLAPLDFAETIGAESRIVDRVRSAVNDYNLRNVQRSQQQSQSQFQPPQPPFQQPQQQFQPPQPQRFDSPPAYTATPVADERNMQLAVYERELEGLNDARRVYGGYLNYLRGTHDQEDPNLSRYEELRKDGLTEERAVGELSRLDLQALYVEDRVHEFVAESGINLKELEGYPNLNDVISNTTRQGISDEIHRIHAREGDQYERRREGFEGEVGTRTSSLGTSTLHESHETITSLNDGVQVYWKAETDLAKHVADLSQEGKDIKTINKRVNDVVDGELKSGNLEDINGQKDQRSGETVYQSEDGALKQKRDSNGMLHFETEENFSGILRVQRVDGKGNKIPNAFDVIEYDKGKPVMVSPSDRGQTQIASFNNIMEQVRVTSRPKMRPEEDLGVAVVSDPDKIASRAVRNAESRHPVRPSSRRGHNGPGSRNKSWIR